MPRFINTELKSDPESSDSDLDSEKVESSKAFMFWNVFFEVAI